MSDNGNVAQLYNLSNDASYYYEFPVWPNNIWADIYNAKGKIEKARAQNPREPVYLFGWSRGGVAACTLSGLLMEERINVDALLVIDPVSTGGLQMIGTNTVAWDNVQQVYLCKKDR
jgi:hypothetical protein